MTINSVSNVSFGNLKMGHSLRRSLARKIDPKYCKQDLERVKKIIMANGLHKQKYVDIILEEKNYIDYADGMFYCIISSKKQGVPMNPCNQCIIGKDEGKIRYFVDWVRDWNESYSPKAIERWHQIKRQAMRALKTIGKKLEWDN